MRFDLIADVLVWLDPHVMVQVQATSAVVHYEMKRVWRDTRREHAKFDAELIAVDGVGYENPRKDDTYLFLQQTPDDNAWYRNCYDIGRQTLGLEQSGRRWGMRVMQRRVIYGGTLSILDDRVPTFIKHNRVYPPDQLPPDSRLLLQVLEDHWSGWQM